MENSENKTPQSVNQEAQFSKDIKDKVESALEKLRKEDETLINALKEVFMELVLLTALGVGGATIFGSAIGFLFKNSSSKFIQFRTFFYRIIISHNCT